MSIKKKIILSISILLVTCFVILYYCDGLKVIDDFFYKIIISVKCEVVTTIFLTFTNLGGIIGTIGLICINLFINKKRGVYFLLNVGFISLLNLLLKNIFIRPRPIGINMIQESGYSFPSGHSMTAVAVYGLLIYFVYNSKINSKLKLILICLSCLCLIFIPISRVYLGVHYFSDILVGAFISLIWIVIYTEILNEKNI